MIPETLKSSSALLLLLLATACSGAGGRDDTAENSEPRQGAETPAAATPAPTVANPASAKSIRVKGNRFVDGAGKTVQPRGVNFSGFEFAAMQGWSGKDPSGGQGGQPGGPKWSAITAWKANSVRIPLNEASWLGKPCTDAAGATHDPDPADNYRESVQTQVAQAIEAGLYVIIDLHWSAPGDTCPLLQMQMANADNSHAFWTSVANTFKNQPAVMFELFNEPFMNFGFSGDSWRMMMHGSGGEFTSYPAQSRSGEWKEIQKNWEVASYQAMLNTVRATGATNVVLIGTMQYAQDFSEWLAHKPTDPLKQMAAVWHPYATFGEEWGTPAYAEPNYAPEVYDDIKAILAAGIPVIATETGDKNTPGTKGAPLVANVTAWADEHGVGVLGWAWDVWEEPHHVLIKDVNGTPTDGYGEVFRDWLLSH